MIRHLRIAHTSDVHLHDGEDAQEVRDGFEQVVNTVVETGVDLFLIAGDLFDHNRVRGDVIDFVYQQLSRVPCRTVIIAGNHDCFEERAVLRRMDFGQAGSHVHLLDDAEGMKVEFPELHATVWGRCMIEHEPENKPMAGSPARTRDLWHIGMAHGLYVDYPETGRSSLITPHEIESSGFDYLALGHVHIHQQVRHGNTLACYPGVPVAYGSRHPPCVTLVDLLPGVGAQARRHLLSDAEEEEQVAERRAA